jgi:hypothetical protein
LARARISFGEASDLPKTINWTSARSDLVIDNALAMKIETLSGRADVIIAPLAIDSPLC